MPATDPCAVRRMVMVRTCSSASRLGARRRPARRAGGLDAVCARAGSGRYRRTGGVAPEEIVSGSNQQKEDHHDRHCENHAE